MSFISKVFPDFNKTIQKPICQSPGPSVNVNVYDEKLYKTPSSVETFQSNTNPNVNVNTNTNANTINTNAFTSQIPNSDKNTEELLIHLNYILNNSLCRDILMKKWGENTERFDVFLYILFAFFLLIIYDNFFKKH
jgi:hypothetical protein